MRMLLIAFVLLAFTAGSSPALAKEQKAAPPASTAKVFNAQTFTLKNGLQVIVVENHRVPAVAHMLWYRAGSADEPYGRSGIAHFLEHLMFKGTPTIPAGEYSKRIRNLGGSDNAMTSYDYTAYHAIVPPDQLDTAMAMEADRMAHLTPPEKDVLSERNVVLDERRQRTENDPGARLAEQLDTALFPNHPYGRPVIGWAEEVSALTWEDGKAYRARWYAPNAAILVVSGDVTPDEVRRLAEKHYGPIPPSDAPKIRQRPPVPALPGTARITLKDPQVREPQLIRLYRAPSLRQDRKQARALEVLEQILDGGPSTRLYRSLVVGQKRAIGIGFSYNGTAYDNATIWLSATPATPDGIPALETALDQELRNLVKNGVTAEELATAKSRMTDAAIYARDSLMGPAYAFGMALTGGGTMDDVENWPRQIDAVTVEDVNAAARALLDPDQPQNPPVTGLLLPGTAPAPAPKSEKGPTP